ncbi:hypothetical protein SERLA73DRAFT_119225 [Serpula lacrymans var. lacrymans S7.3]|uniref:Uncharacterized protein n=1 Tax=Serpula lacrymans var. lacrymans (strain S7.3) TaxID=936435 RepID=F8PK64_SERL3|nr:hypothetical protein SERLA73DRAFT_119225 [Serpula lacrymans var. lacrymans S7.3]
MPQKAANSVFAGLAAVNIRGILGQLHRIHLDGHVVLQSPKVRTGDRRGLVVIADTYIEKEAPRPQSSQED